MALIGIGVVVSFVVVIDEILTLALYCGITCLYPYPWSQPLPIYTAYEQAVAWIYGGVASLVLGTNVAVREATK
jgi:hypothetical protein